MNTSYNPFENIDQRLSNIESMLSKISQPQHIPQPTQQIEGGIDLAKEVLKVYSKSSIYKMSMQGRIPCERRGRKLWFNRTTLELWIKQGMPDHSQLNAADRLAATFKR